VNEPVYVEHVVRHCICTPLVGLSTPALDNGCHPAY